MSAQPLDVRMARLEGAFEQVDKRLESIDRRLDRLADLFESRFTWLTGIVVGTWITTTLAIIFHK
jgi:tetrahydromethanopterin S-methyltransferase subunit G